MQLNCLHSKLLLEYLAHQSRIRNKFCRNCLLVTRQLENQSTFEQQFAALFRSWFQRMRCTSVRVSFPEDFCPCRCFHIANLHLLSRRTFHGVGRVGLIISLPRRDFSFRSRLLLPIFLTYGSLKPSPEISISSPLLYLD